MKPEAVTKAFQTELVQLMNKYTGGAMNKKIGARDRCRLASDFQIYLLMAATKALIPTGTKTGVESVIKSNCATFERLQRMVYKFDEVQPVTTRGEGNGPQAPSENTIPQTIAEGITKAKEFITDPVVSSGEVEIISREAAKELGLPGTDGTK